FICNANGQWVGSWPLCQPKVYCPKEDIYSQMDSSVMIEEIGNVYYMNESHWFAMNDSWVRYTCGHENDIMVGKSIRSCMSGLSISGLLLAILGTFVVIVVIVFRRHSRRVNLELRETRYELQETKRYLENCVYANPDN
ncbi:unnamed protein product, partial [Oppiella nova]